MRITKSGGLYGTLPLPNTAFEKDYPRVGPFSNAEHLLRDVMKRVIRDYSLTETEQCAILTKMQWEVLAGCLVGERQVAK